MANSFYGANVLVGGGTGALDDINHNNLSDGDGAIVIDAVNDKAYLYTYNSSSSASEVNPDVINPDSNSGNGRWILVSVYSNTLDANSATIASAVINSLTLNSGATVTEFSTDDTLAGDSDTAVPTEQAVKAYIDSFIPTGYVNRAWFQYSDTDTITIGAGMYHHSGTKEQMVYWASDLTFDFGSGGTNADSTDLANEDWFYLYIDDSAVVTAGTNVLTATELVAVTDEPSWSNTKLGWYNGNDRCIGAFYTNGSAELEEFTCSGDSFQFATGVNTRTLATLSDVSGWVDMNGVMPKFSLLGVFEVQLYSNTQTSLTRLKYRTNGVDSGANGHICCATWDSGQRDYNVITVVTNFNQKIEISTTQTGAQQVGGDQVGWFFGNGI